MASLTGNGRRALRAGGFTIIEVLIVLAILATLMTLVAPKYFGALEKSKESALKENLAVLRYSIDRFKSDHDRYPESLQELVDRSYLRSIPIDPVLGSNTDWVVVRSEKDGKNAGISDVRSAAKRKSSDGDDLAAW